MNHKNKVKKYYFSRRPAVSFPEKIGLKINFSLDPYPTQKKSRVFFIFMEGTKNENFDRNLSACFFKNYLQRAYKALEKLGRYSVRYLGKSIWLKGNKHL